MGWMSLVGQDWMLDWAHRLPSWTSSCLFCLMYGKNWLHALPGLDQPHVLLAVCIPAPGSCTWCDVHWLLQPVHGMQQIGWDRGMQCRQHMGASMEAPTQAWTYVLDLAHVASLWAQSGPTLYLPWRASPEWVLHAAHALDCALCSPYPRLAPHTTCSVCTSFSPSAACCMCCMQCMGLGTAHDMCVVQAQLESHRQHYKLYNWAPQAVSSP